MRHLLTVRRVRVFAGGLVLLALYAAAGFLLAPKILRSVLIAQVQKSLRVTPAVGAIRFNPFLLQLVVEKFALPDPAGRAVVGFDRLFVDFELSSLWHRAYVFEEIAIDAPFVRVVVGSDGVTNLLRLRPQAAPQQPATAAAPLPRIEVANLALSRGSVTYEDLSRLAHFAMRLDPIAFAIRDFTTGAAGGTFDFTGVSKLGERIAWRGHFSLQPVQSEGELRIAGLRARTVWAYLKDRLQSRIGFDVDSGSVDIEAHYRFSLREAIDLQVTVPKASMTALAVEAAGSDQKWISLPALDVAGASLDLRARRVHVDAVKLTGLNVAAWLEPDRTLNLSRLGAAPSAGTAAIHQVQRLPAARDSAGAAPRWQVDLREFDLVGASLSAEDRSVRPAAKLVLAPLSLSVAGASADLARPLEVRLDTGVNGAGRFALTGQIVPRPLAARLTVEAQRLGLEALQPYIAERTALTLTRGRLSGKVRLRYGQGKPSTVVTGRVQVDDLRTVDNALHDDLIKWRRLDVRGVKFQLDPNRLDIDSIVAREPYARVIIAPDRTVNIRRILSAPGAQAAPPPAAPTPSAAANRPAAPLLPISIRTIDVADGHADFSDLSITPNFAAGIDRLSGSIRGLKPNAQSRATVDLHGEVGPYAPVSITGEVNVFGPVLHTDLTMDFRNIDLTIFNPYSGKFAGYNITKGKLTTDLHYKIDGRKLDAQHHIIVDQLEFGAKTASKDAVSLPVKLAVALLKDRRGVIDLNLPVTGSLDDPRFRLGPLIWKALFNLLVKAVTAPFALLGSLLGAGPDIQFVDFQPGAAELDAAGLNKMQELAKALIQRPQLKIDVPISSIAQMDLPVMVDARFGEEVGAAAAARVGAKKGGRVTRAPAGQGPDAAARLALLTAMYRAQFAAAPRFPAPVAKPSPAAEGQAPAGQGDPRLTYLEAQLKSRIVIGDADLKSLAERRAVAIQKALLTGTTLDAARVFLVANDKAVRHDGMVRVQLSLE